MSLDEQELSALQQRAMRAAEAYGCEAGVQVADFVASDPPGSLRLQVVVVRRSPQGTLLSGESKVVVMTDEHAASVEQIVRDAAAKLSLRSAGLMGSQDQDQDGLTAWDLPPTLGGNARGR